MNEKKDDGKWEQGRKGRGPGGPLVGGCLSREPGGKWDGSLLSGRGHLFYLMRMRIMRGAGAWGKPQGSMTSQGSSGNCSCLQQPAREQHCSTCQRGSGWEQHCCSGICSWKFFFFQPSVKTACGFSAVREGGYSVVYFPGVFPPLSFVTNFLLFTSPLPKPLFCPLPLT